MEYVFPNSLFHTGTMPVEAIETGHDKGNTHYQKKKEKKKKLTNLCSKKKR